MESRTVAEPRNVIRGLVCLANAELDRALFFTPSSLPMWPARRAILADRRGPDGRPIIGAALRERLIQELSPVRGMRFPRQREPRRSAADQDRSMTSITVGAAPTASRTRLAICWLTIAATLPYLFLKIAWVCGSSIGVTGDAMKDHAFVAVNSLTILMDATAATAALSLVKPWGLRMPAAVLLFPTWAATGFLGPIVVGAPFVAIVDGLAHSRSAAPDSSTSTLAGWVPAVVYTGFGLQGIGLAVGFVLYARVRWGRVLTLTSSAMPTSVTYPAQRAIAMGVAGVSVAPALVRIYWALGGRQGVPFGDSSLGTYAVQGVFGAFALAGAWGVVTLLGRRDERPILRPLLAAWLGTGTMFGWGFWAVLSAAMSTAIGVKSDEGVMIGIGSLQMTCGAVLATLLALAVVEAHAMIES
jgi:hypothetical protein